MAAWPGSTASSSRRASPRRWRGDWPRSASSSSRTPPSPNTCDGTPRAAGGADAGRRLDRDRAADLRLERLEAMRSRSGQKIRDVGMHAQHEGARSRVRGGGGPGLPERVVGPRLGRALAARALAVRARAAQQLAEALARPLAGHLDEPQLRDPQDVRARLVGAHRILEDVKHLLAVRWLLHVDEIDHDDPAQVAQPELRHHLLRRLQVGLEDGLLLGLLADVASGVDVDGGERLGLLDHEVAARLEPHAAIERPGDLGLGTVLLEERRDALVVGAR